MVFRKIKREELEKLYTHEGITRSELRYLLRVTPNQITDRLSDVFRKELNPFRFSKNHELILRGFIHSPPKKALQLFNSIHYELISQTGQYSLFILSSSPLDTNMAVPIIIPNDIIGKNKLSYAHFAKISGAIYNLNQLKKNSLDANFIIAKEVNILGFNELFSTIDPVLQIVDLADMIKNRFTIPELERKSIIFWLMSSPVYEARAGGNAFSPISPAEDKYKCNEKVLSDFQNELLKINLPYFSKSKSRSCVFDYNSPIKMKLSFFQSPEIFYRYEKNLEVARKFLEIRSPLKDLQNSEINLSTTTLMLDSLMTRPLESFVRKPVMDSELLKLTDLPVLFTNNDLFINDSEKEIFEYNMEISQLIYQARLKNPLSPFEFVDTAGAVKTVVDRKMKSFPELRELMMYGIIFDLSPIGGLGEHLTRISNSILRSNETLDKKEAIIKSEDFFIEMITKLFDEFDTPIKNLYNMLEEKRADRDQIRTHRLRNMVNSILFELNNTFKDGWRYEQFELEFKKRSGFGAKKTNEIFEKLLAQKEISERSPGLYWHILGFDRY